MKIGDSLICLSFHGIKKLRVRAYAPTPPENRKSEIRKSLRREGNAKTDVEVPELRVDPVPVRRADDPRDVEPGTAAQDPVRP